MVFLIAVSYHSKVATGRPGQASLAPKPIRTFNPEVALYKMKADLSGNIRLVAPNSATARQQLESGEMEE